MVTTDISLAIFMKITAEGFIVDAFVTCYSMQ